MNLNLTGSQFIEPSLAVGLNQGHLVDKVNVLSDKYNLTTYIKQLITWCQSAGHESIIFS